jgi:hypothetical protein
LKHRAEDLHFLFSPDERSRWEGQLLPGALLVLSTHHPGWILHAVPLDGRSLGLALTTIAGKSRHWLLLSMRIIHLLRGVVYDLLLIIQA